MPTYDYECTKCGHAFDAFQSMSEDALTDCPSCGKSTLKRLIGGGLGVIFKGSGFYSTDSRGSGGGSKEKTGEASGDSKSDSSGDSKSDSSSASKESSGNGSSKTSGTGSKESSKSPSESKATS